MVVADVVRAAVVRVAVLAEAQVVGVRAVRAVGRRRPRLDVALERVGGVLIRLRAGGVAVAARDVGRADQAGDLGRDRVRRPAALVLPALLVAVRPVGDKVVGGRAHVRPVRRAAAVQPPRENDRQRGLVELLPRPVLRAVDLGVLPERAVRLLHAPQEVEQPAGGGAVAGDLLGGRDVVEVARPDEVVRAGRLAVLERQRAPHPRHRRRGDGGAAVQLVLGRGEHEQRLVVELEELRSRRTYCGGFLSPARYLTHGCA